MVNTSTKRERVYPSIPAVQIHSLALRACMSASQLRRVAENLTVWRRKLKQPKNFIPVQATMGGTLLHVQNLPKQLPFRFEDFVDPLFDRPCHDHARDGDTASGPDPMRPIDGLILDRRIPPAIKQEYVSAKLQVQPCLLYTSPSPRDATLSRMPSSA